MDTRLRYISISHHTAPVARRERFHLSDTAKQEVARALQMAFPDLMFPPDFGDLQQNGIVL